MNSPEQRKRWPEPTTDEPTIEDLERWMNDGVCESTNGERVEPDGIDSDGYPSWLLYLGLI